MINLFDEEYLQQMFAQKNQDIGIEKGIEKGRKEAFTDTAKRMLEDHVPDETIVKYSGLSMDEVLALKNDLQPV